MADGLCVCSFVPLVVLCVFHLLRFVRTGTGPGTGTGTGAGNRPQLDNTESMALVFVRCCSFLYRCQRRCTIFCSLKARAGVRARLSLHGERFSDHSVS